MLDLTPGTPDPTTGSSEGKRTIDELETDLLAAEAVIAELRAYQAGLLRELREQEVYRLDGARTMRDWIAARLDVSQRTAGDLWTALKAASFAENVSFDRAVATARLIDAGGDAGWVEWSKRYDIAGVNRLVAHCRRVRRVDEIEANRSQYFRVCPNVERSIYHTSGQFNPLGGKVVEKFLADLADGLPHPGEGELWSREYRQAIALVAHAEDYLATTNPGYNDRSGDASEGASMDESADTARSSGSGGEVNVFVDTSVPVSGDAPGGEIGAAVEYGPRIGPQALEELLCSGRIRLVIQDGGRPVASTHATRQIPPHIRAFVVKRDGACTVAGCTSRYRLEPHHIIPRSRGGTHDPDNLTTLCWYHHHVVVHQHGRQLDPHSPPNARCFLPVRKRAPPDV